MNKSEFQATILLGAVEEMHGKVFYCEDEEGVLRRWYPPRLPNLESLKELKKKVREN